MERKPVENIDSYVEMEQYLGSIIFPIRKAIRGNIYWKSKHAPNNVGEAMKKAEELYMKHVYTTGGSDEQSDIQTAKEVSINKVYRHPQATHSEKTEIPARSRQLGTHTGSHSRKSMKTTERARSRQSHMVTGAVKKA